MLPAVDNVDYITLNCHSNRFIPRTLRQKPFKHPLKCSHPLLVLTSEASLTPLHAFLVTMMASVSDRLYDCVQLFRLLVL